MVPILIVDDAQEDLVFAQRVLSSNRILNPVLPFSSGKACLDYFNGKSAAFESQLPCVVLLDMVMKPLGGLDVLRALQDLPAAKGSIIIMLSGLADIKMVSEGYRLGASTFLIKPLVAAELKQMLTTERPGSDRREPRDRPSVPVRDELPGHPEPPRPLTSLVARDENVRPSG